jgi:phosphatidylglycerophosphate synthase
MKDDGMADVTTTQKPFRGADRVLTSILAGPERRTLRFLAERMPAWVNSDHLTVLGLVAMLGTGLAFWAAGTQPWAVSLVAVCLAINWFGDSLDGTLARVRGHERPRYGFYVDHVVDIVGSLFLLGGLALSGYMSPLVAAGVLIAFLMMSAEVFLAAHTLGQFKITYANLGPTELRILLAIGALWLLVKPDVVLFGRTFHLFDVGGVVAIAGLLVIFTVTAIAHTRALYRAEPIAEARRARGGAGGDA